MIVDYRRYPAHRLIWLYVYGKWPDGEIDHINGDKADNRIENLRDVQRHENAWNMGKHKTNTSGFKNVFWHKKDKRWFVSVTAKGKRHYATGFDSPEAANAAAMELRAKLHGPLARA